VAAGDYLLRAETVPKMQLLTFISSMMKCMFEIDKLMPEQMSNFGYIFWERSCFHLQYPEFIMPF